ncbi:MAG TPA: hypothetical protein PKI71_15525, partial [Candidatus Rifleibacterium sp.]|nr:hypothetical protein [Candidatus Rifleibacterium sp.]
MQIYPEIKFGQDEANERLVIDFGANRSFLGFLPLLLLLPGGYCFLMSMFNEGVLSTYGVPLGILFLVIALILTAIAQYYFTDRVFFDRKIREVWQETRCGTYIKEDFRFSFDQLAGIGLSGKWRKDKYGSYWEFAIVIVSQAGVIKPVTLYFREDRFRHYVETARTISSFVGREFVEPNI